MKQKTIFTLFFLAAFAAGSWAQSSMPRSEKTKSRDYGYSEREKFVTDMKDELKRVDMQLESLKEQAGELKDQVARETKQKIDALKAKSSELKDQVEKADNIAEAGWNETKSDINKSMGELRNSVDQMNKFINKKEAPGKSSGTSRSR